MFDLLKGFHDRPIEIPRNAARRPDRDGWLFASTDSSRPDPAYSGNGSIPWRCIIRATLGRSLSSR